jgi:hypothetical protein
MRLNVVMSVVMKEGLNATEEPNRAIDMLHVVMID